MRQNELPISDIKNMMVDRVLDLIHVLAPGGKVQGSFYSAKNPSRSNDSSSSFKITVKGIKAGSWVEYDSGEKGDILHLIAYANGYLDFKAKSARQFSINWAKDYLGLSRVSPEKLKTIQKQAAKSRVDNEAEELARQERKKDRAREIFFNAQPIKPSDILNPVRVYLKSRGIDWKDLKDLESDIKYHPHLKHWAQAADAPPLYCPAMVCAIRQANGDINGIHATFLKPNGEGKITGSNAKLMLGEAKGGVVRISKGEGGFTVTEAILNEKQGTVVLCEGVETGASLALAIPQARVWACLSLGNLENGPIELECNDAVVVALENDTKPQALALREKVLEALEAKAQHYGIAFMTMKPSFGNDFNDDLNA